MATPKVPVASWSRIALTLRRRQLRPRRHVQRTIELPNDLEERRLDVLHSEVTRLEVLGLHGDLPVDCRDGIHGQERTLPITRLARHAIVASRDNKSR